MLVEVRLVVAVTAVGPMVVMILVVSWHWLHRADHDAHSQARTHKHMHAHACTHTRTHTRTHTIQALPPYAKPQSPNHRQARLLLESADSLRADLAALGSGLAWHLGPPPSILQDTLRRIAPALLTHGVSRVRLLLHHAPEATLETCRAEAAAVAAFEEEARSLGLSYDVRGCWGATLYHPDDLPYAAFAGGTRKSAMHGPMQQQQQQQGRRQQEHGEAVWSRGGEVQAEDQGIAPTAAADATSAAAPTVEAAPNSDPHRYRHLPRVMTDFRKAVQALSPVRSPLPAPPTLPPLPPGAGDPSNSDWWAPLPTDVQSLYESAGPEAVAALRRLAVVTAMPQLAAASGVVPAYAGAGAHPASAFPFSGGERQAGERLRGFLRDPLELYGDAR